jgi:DNA-binding Lrp family transcriptional regulator
MLEEQDEIEDILHILIDEDMRKILQAATSEDKSIGDISRKKMISLSTCYRRVQELLGLQLLRVGHTIINQTGKKYQTYRSVLIDAKVVLTPDDFAVEVTLAPKI